MNSNRSVMGREEWVVALGQAPLSEQRRKGHEITIRWFMGWCDRQRPGVEPSREAARRFYLDKVRERNPAEWQKARWGAALRWYSEWREAEVARDESRRRLPRKGGGAGGAVVTACAAEVGREVERPRAAMTAKDSWEVRLVRLIRLRHLSYRTEQAYLGWCRRLARRFRGRDLEGLRVRTC